MANQTESKQALAKKEMSERFIKSVTGKYGWVARGVPITEKEKAIIAGYFICIDEALKAAEIKWNDIDLNALALDLAHKARLGLDMQMPNYLYPVPYKNKKTEVVTLTLIDGYKGAIHLAMKFAEKIPLNIRAELVYDTDEFIPLKRGLNNVGDNYEFKINKPFDRGKVIGGFGYIEYDDPSKNVLVIMSKDDILKRKPSYTSNKFWGDWEEKMFLKTVIKETCKHIPLDVDKVREYNNTLSYEESRKVEYAQAEIDAEVSEKANTTPIDIPQTPPQELPQAPIEYDMQASSRPEAIPQEQQTPPPMTEEYEEPDF